MRSNPCIHWHIHTATERSNQQTFSDSQEKTVASALSSSAGWSRSENPVIARKLLQGEHLIFEPKSYITSGMRRQRTCFKSPFILTQLVLKGIILHVSLSFSWFWVLDFTSFSCWGWASMLCKTCFNVIIEKQISYKKQEYGSLLLFLPNGQTVVRDLLKRTLWVYKRQEISLIKTTKELFYTGSLFLFLQNPYFIPYCAKWMSRQERKWLKGAGIWWEKVSAWCNRDPNKPLIQHTSVLRETPPHPHLSSRFLGLSGLLLKWMSSFCPISCSAQTLLLLLFHTSFIISVQPLTTHIICQCGNLSYSDCSFI